MKQINANKNKNHSRVSLSGIFNACRGRIEIQQQSVENPRLQISGMAPLFYNSVRAFTLIELLVVVLIIGILSAIALPQYQKAVMKARFTELVILQNAIYRAEQAYFLANGEYTSHFDELDVQLPGGSTTYEEDADRSLWQGDHVSIYLSKSWNQGYSSGGLSYVIGYDGKRVCRSYDRTSASQQVCLSMGGVKSECSSCNYDNYVLP